MDIRLAEDSPDDAELAIYGLKKHNPANRPDCVNDGGAAPSRRFHRGAYIGYPNTLPSVVRRDLRRPNAGGIEVPTQIRANPDTHELPAFVLTSSTEERDLMQTYKLGVNSFVAKPAFFNEFAKTTADLGMYRVLVNRVPTEIRGV